MTRPFASSLLAGAAKRALELEAENERMRDALEQIERAAVRCQENPNGAHLDPGWAAAHCSVGLGRGGVL